MTTVTVTVTVTAPASASASASVPALMLMPALAVLVLAVAMPTVMPKAMLVLAAAPGTRRARIARVLSLFQFLPVFPAPAREPHKGELALVTQARMGAVCSRVAAHRSRCPMAHAQRCVWTATKLWCCSQARVCPHPGSMCCPWALQASS